MYRHVNILGRLWIICSVLIALAALAAMLMLLSTFHERQAAGGFLFVGLLSVPGIIGGIGILKRRSWARKLALALGVINLFSFPPIGTALGAYTICVLLKRENARLFAHGSKP